MSSIGLQFDNNINFLDEALSGTKNLNINSINRFVILQKQSVFVDHYLVFLEPDTSRCPFLRNLYSTFLIKVENILHIFQRINICLHSQSIYQIRS